MRKVLEVLRLLFDQDRSQREIATILALSQGTVHNYVARFRATGLPWPLPAELDETALDAQLFRRGELPPSATRPVPDWATVHQELKRKGVTLQLLWAEHKEAAAEPARCYQYTQFCRLYHAWAGTLEPVLRQVHVAGERLFVDYAGPTMPVVDPRTDEIREAQIFVGALGASHLLYVEATWTQTLPDWIGAHVRMLEYIGAVPALIAPDNLKSAVGQPCYYEPTVHATYQDFATHYGTAILPARAYHPRDKAKVETAVQIVEREMMAPLRHDVFHSLAELNHSLAVARERVNDRPFQNWRVVGAASSRPPSGRRSGPAGRAVRARGVEDGQGQHRLSHLRRGASLQRAVSARRRRGDRAPHRDDARDPASGHARRRPCAECTERALHHRAHASAQVPPAPPRHGARPAPPRSGAADAPSPRHP